MAIEKINNTDIMQQTTGGNLKKYAEKILSEDKNQTPIDKIKEENKGFKIDTKA